MSGSGPIVFVDGDQTLWDFQAVMRRALRIVLVELRRLRPGPPTAGLTVESMVEDRARTAAALRGRQTDLERLRLASFRHTLARIGIPDDALAAQQNALYRQHRFAGVELYPDVLPALRTVGADHRLGLLSNGNSYPERCGSKACSRTSCSPRTTAWRSRTAGSSGSPRIWPGLHPRIWSWSATRCPTTWWAPGARAGGACGSTATARRCRRHSNRRT